MLQREAASLQMLIKLAIVDNLGFKYCQLFSEVKLKVSRGTYLYENPAGKHEISVDFQ